jgi:hypothetical protein
MRRKTVLLAMAAASLQVQAEPTGFVQLRQVQRSGHAESCVGVEGCRAMAQEALAELLFERPLSANPAGSLRPGGALRLEALADGAIRSQSARLREAYAEVALGGDSSVRLGRQVLSWGVSDYLFANDLFPKNYDAFFTGAGFDRLKQPVDALRLSGATAGIELEAVVAKSRADQPPDARRFTAMGGTRAATEARSGDSSPDVLLKAATRLGSWDAAAYAGRFRTREPRYFADGAGLQFDRPWARHLGISATGNAWGGVLWAEAAVRQVEQRRPSVVSRNWLGSGAKAIVGYSRQLAPDVQLTTQWQAEAPSSPARDRASLAPGVRPVRRATSTLHLRLQGRWSNQTLSAGMQAFVGCERDSHLNPFASWSPADGWVVEGGLNLFSGRPDTRYGALEGDSNAYISARFSF